MCSSWRNKRLHSMVDGGLRQVLQIVPEQGRRMQARTQRLILRGGIIVLAAVLVSTVGAWAGGTTTEADRTPASGPELLGELRSLRQQLDAKQGELEVARLQLDRVDAIMQYSTHTNSPPDVPTRVYNGGLSGGTRPRRPHRLTSPAQR